MKFIQSVTLTALTAIHAVLPASAEWTEVNEIRNPKAEEYYGYSLALSPNFLAVGAPYDDNEFGDEDTGVVHIYKRTGDNSLETGKILYGQEQMENFGFSMDFAVDSDILVVGSPMDSVDTERPGMVRVYSYDDIVADRWSQLGQDIEGRDLNESFGQSVTISDDGNIIAVGAGQDDETSKQRVNIYTLNRDTGKWTSVGEIKIPDAEEAEDLDPVKVDIVQNGDEEEYYLALSSGRFKHGEGLVMVFQITTEHLQNENAKQEFQLVGRRLVGRRDHDELGVDISLGLNEGIIYLAVGGACTGYYDDTNDDKEEAQVKSDSRVEVYTFETSSVKDPDARWKLVSTIGQIENEDGTGEAVVISRDGMRLVVGSPKFSDFEGAVRVFDFHKGDYAMVGEEFFLGEGDYDEFGSKVAMYDLDIVVSSVEEDYVKMYRYDGASHYGRHINGRGRSGFVSFILAMFIISIVGAIGYCAYASVKQGRISLPRIGLPTLRRTYQPTPTVANINQNNTPSTPSTDRVFASGGVGLPSEDPIEASGVDLMGARKATNIETKEMV